MPRRRHAGMLRRDGDMNAPHYREAREDGTEREGAGLDLHFGCEPVEQGGGLRGDVDSDAGHRCHHRPYR